MFNSIIAWDIKLVFIHNGLIIFSNTSLLVCVYAGNLVISCSQVRSIAKAKYLPYIAQDFDLLGKDQW